jgi:glycosyltransferase involved in cell wall biosynthesis
MMKLLVFAHTPPPHHGQSYMVKLMLDGFGGDVRQNPARQAGTNNFGIECYHVNARFSKSLEDIGSFQGGKLFLIFYYCLQAIWIRFRYGVENFYYVPAPGKKVAVYRDWLVMFLCRPFFKHVILHWHAAGLGKWLEASAPMSTRAMTYRLFKPVNLSLILSHYNLADAAKLLSQKVALVNNCAPDQCPDFTTTVLPQRQARHAARRQLLAGQTLPAAGLAGNPPEVVNILFLAHCSREKGLFDALDGVVLANQKLARRGIGLQLQLSVAGGFVDATEKAEFDAHLTQPEYAAAVEYVGFISGADKLRRLQAADVMSFPSYYLGENQPVSLIEAMSFGLPILTTYWRSLPEMLPSNYPGLVPPRSPAALAEVLLQLIASESGEGLREHYLAHFTVTSHLTTLAKALRSVETEGPSAVGAPNPN